MELDNVYLLIVEGPKGSEKALCRWQKVKFHIMPDQSSNVDSGQMLSRLWVQPAVMVVTFEREIGQLLPWNSLTSDPKGHDTVLCMV